MEFINEWTYTICVTLIISVVFSILLPSGSMWKFSKMILSVFIFISFIIPLKNADLDIEFPEFAENSLNEEQQNSYEGIITSNVRKTLVDGGYDGCVIDFDVDCSSNEISIDKAVISINDCYDKQEVKDYIYNKLGLVAEVYYIGE